MDMGMGGMDTHMWIQFNHLDTHMGILNNLDTRMGILNHRATRTVILNHRATLMGIQNHRATLMGIQNHPLKGILMDKTVRGNPNRCKKLILFLKVKKGL